MRSRVFALLALVAAMGVVGFLTSSEAQSQLGVFKQNVGLQPTTPGTAQSGHANLSGTIRAGQFAGDGSGLSNLNASALSSGVVSMDRLPGNVARIDTPNAFTQTNRFDDFVGIGTSTPFTGADRFRIANRPGQDGYTGMYISSDQPSGLPFYGYVAGSATAWTLLDSAGNWRLFNGGDFPLVVTANGNVGLGNFTPTERLDVGGNAKVFGHVTANEYRTTVQRRYVMIGYEEFWSRGNYSGNGPFARIANTWITNGELGAGLGITGENYMGGFALFPALWARIRVPEGAILKEISIKAANPSTTTTLNFHCRVSIRKIPIDSNAATTVANLTLPAESYFAGVVKTRSAQLPDVVAETDDAIYQLGLDLVPGSTLTGSSFAIIAVRIGYDIDRIQP